MIILIVSILVLLGAIALALFVREDTGHIVIAYGDWTIETSLVLFVAAVLLAFLVLYYIIRLWSGIVTTPERLRRWRRQRRNAKARQAYVRGMNALSEGHWETAEKWLLKEVRHSETPALNYLAAAQAAEAQGSQVRRDAYLRLAHENDPKATVAVSLARASYQLAHQQGNEALGVLAQLHIEQPKHPTVLKKLMEAYAEQQDWERLLEIVPDLEKRKVIPVHRSEEMQRGAYRALFARAAEQRDIEQLHKLWDRTPRYVKRNDDVIFDYARALSAVDTNAGTQLEPLLADAIRRRWSEALVYAYGFIPYHNIPAQLAQAERWLKHHPDNAVLLLTLGRLCVRGQLWGKGRSYLEASLAIDPQPETYRELGNLLEKLNNKGAALDCYRNALVLVPAKSFPSLEVQTKYKPMPPGGMPLLPLHSA